VVGAGIVPDPLQTFEPRSGAAGPALKNEAMLPVHPGPLGGACALRGGASAPGGKVWLVSLAPKAKLHQVMMTVAQEAAFEFVAVWMARGGFTEAHDAAAARAIAGLDETRLLLFGGWESASRGAAPPCKCWASYGADAFAVMERLNRILNGRAPLDIFGYTQPSATIFV
jgi:electron transfer flavoprotein beta subunit